VERLLRPPECRARQGDEESQKRPPLDFQ
jgi:hypothetical protein